MSRRHVSLILLALSALPLMSFRMEEQATVSREKLFYDVRGALVTARADVSRDLVAETDRLVDAAIRATIRQISLPRTILTVRIDRAGYLPFIIGGRHEARVSIEAIAVGTGEMIAAGSFGASVFALEKEDGDALLAEKIASRIATEFRLDGKGGSTLATALSP